MHRRTYLRRGVALAGPVLGGCTGGGDGGGAGPTVVETTSVTMADAQFEPRNVHVDAGATVTWGNEDSTAHTVTAASENWSMDAEVSGDAAAEYTFEDDRVYDAYCRYHGAADLTGMAMKVGVGDAAIENPLGGDGGSGGNY